MGDRRVSLPQVSRLACTPRSDFEYSTWMPGWGMCEVGGKMLNSRLQLAHYHPLPYGTRL